jgi:hypothetical protein
MASISGEVTAGEASTALRTIGARQRGSAVWIFVIALAAYGVSFAVAMLAAGIYRAFFEPPRYLDTLVLMVGLVGGLVLYFRVCRPVLNRRFRAQMKRRGLQTQFPYALTLSEGGIRQDSGAVQKSAEWRVVTEAFATKDHWVFLVQTEPWVAPRRFFKDRVEEQDFIAEALAHMTPEARERSPQATALANPA